MQAQVQDLEGKLGRWKDMMNEKDTEVRIMKRERDEYLTQKVEFQIENKKLKVIQVQLQIHYQKELEDIQKQHETQSFNPQEELNSGQHQNEQSSKFSKFIPNLFGSKKDFTRSSTLSIQQQPSRPSLIQQKIVVMDEQFENEQKEVINIMQSQIQVKIQELQTLQKANDELNLEMGRVKGLIAKEKERSEDFSTDVEIAEMKIKKQDEMLIQKDKEIVNLKVEIQKLRATSESEIKKIRKVQQNSNGTITNNLTTNGSNDGQLPKLNQAYSMDPYTNSKKPNLNQSVMLEYQSSARDTKLRPSTLRNDSNGAIKAADLNNTFHVGFNDNSSAGIQSQQSNRSGNKESLFGSAIQRSRLFSQKSQKDKKVTMTKKYDHVKSSLTTGKTIKDVEILSDKLVAKRASEKFRRIKCTTLAKLLNGINFNESVYNWKGEGNEEVKEEFKLSDMINDTESIYSMRTDATQKTSVTIATDQLGITRNQKDKMIVIYVNDEKLGSEVASKMVEKGYENSYLLSGGIEKFNEECSDLVEGNDVPIPQKKIAEEKEQQKQMKRTHHKVRHAECKKD